jgi:glyoxylase-like metal-dependent hydrolase (beta-lactamase superfamily II)
MDTSQAKLTSPPQITPDELARQLERGDRVQVLDIRAAERVAAGRVGIGTGLEFHALPGSHIYKLPSLDSVGLEAQLPVAVICGHGNSSQRMTHFLRERGLQAFSVTGGMAAWESVYVPRALTPTATLSHVIQVDRIGKGALSYILVSDRKALVVDPGRHGERYTSLLAELEAQPVGVVDTHVHADYLSGAVDLAASWGVPYYLHAEDAASPYDGTPARFEYQAIQDGQEIRWGRASLVVRHTPGHTLGSVTMVVDDDLALTGDFIFLNSIGRPDLGGKAREWGEKLWQSLEQARSHWTGDLLILPAHYAGEQERRADRVVAGRFDAIAATNPALQISSHPQFLSWLENHAVPAPEVYRTIKLANLRLVQLAAAEAEIAESGANQCAVG